MSNCSKVCQFFCIWAYFLFYIKVWSRLLTLLASINCAVRSVIGTLLIGEFILYFLLLFLVVFQSVVYVSLHVYLSNRGNFTQIVKFFTTFRIFRVSLVIRTFLASLWGKVEIFTIAAIETRSSITIVGRIIGTFFS